MNVQMGAYSVQHFDGPELVVWFAATLLFLCVGVLLGVWYRRYLGTRLKAAMGWAAVALVLAVGTSLYAILTGEVQSPRDIGDIIAISGWLLAHGGVFFLVVPFVVRLLGVWVWGQAPDAERQPGREGVRAALSVGNVTCIVGISLLAWWGWDISPWATLAITAGLVMIQPALTTLAEADGAAVPEAGSATDAPTSQVDPQNVSEERERVMRLLEDGRITAEESAELLSALGRTIPPAPAGRLTRPLSGPTRLMVIGAAVVLVAFFLPWFAVNAGKELNRAVRSMQPQMPQQMQQQMQSWGASSNMPLPFMKVQTGTAYIAGGDVGRYLGWVILAMSVGAAVVMLLPQLDSSTAKLIALLTLGAGTVFVLYLLTSGFRHIHIGMVLVMVGYAMQIIALLRGGVRMRMSAAVPA